MNLVSKIIFSIIWLGIAIGFGEAFVDLTNTFRDAAIQAHQRGPISYKLFTEQLTGQK